MSTITLEKIQTKQTELAQMIAAYAASAPTILHVPEAHIELKPGERYAGRLLDELGNVESEVVRLPIVAPRKMNYADAAAFAAEHPGARLPTLRELALMRTNPSAGEFEKRWTWSSEHSGADYAFAQTFGGGGQDGISKSHGLAVVLVRS